MDMSVLVIMLLGVHSFGGVLVTCGECNKIPFPNVQLNKRMLESPFLVLPNLSQISCAIECQKRTSCASLCYNTTHEICTLYDITSNTGGHIVSFPLSTYSEVNTWPMTISGVCADHTCKTNEVCEANPEGNVYICTTECYRPSDINNGSVIFDAYTQIWNSGSVLNYTCQLGFYKTGVLECLESSQWSIVTCTAVTSCTDIYTRCMSNFIQGDYLVYTNEYKVMKFLCSSAGDSYLTLLAPNYSIIPGSTCSVSTSWGQTCGTTTFNKIKISGFTLVSNNQAYSSHTACGQGMMRFGTAAACGADDECEADSGNGVMHINMTGTGLIVDPVITWSKFGDESYLNVVKDSDVRIMDIYCNGDCGVCLPNGDVSFLFNELDTVDLSSATLPTCD